MTCLDLGPTRVLFWQVKESKEEPKEADKKEPDDKDSSSSAHTPHICRRPPSRFFLGCVLPKRSSDPLKRDTLSLINHGLLNPRFPTTCGPLKIRDTSRFGKPPVCFFLRHFGYPLRPGCDNCIGQGPHKRKDGWGEFFWVVTSLSWVLRYEPPGQQ